MISNQDRARIAQAIREAESNTAGQIVCVLARASSDYSYAPFLWATAIALIAPWPMIVFAHWSVVTIYLAQIAIFILSALILSTPPLRMALTPRPIQRVRAHRAAMEQFFARGLTKTKGRTGVMIFVSLAERYVHIVADDGVASRVDKQEWRAAVEAMIAEMREGRIAEGFVAAIEKCGAVLTRHVPPDGERDTLPDQIYVM